MARTATATNDTDLWTDFKRQSIQQAVIRLMCRDGMRSGIWPVFGTAFAVVFLAEFGDLTQFLTVSLAARFHDPISVGIGATLALWVAAAVAVTLGWRVLKLIPMHWLTRGAAVVMIVLAGTSAYAAASG